MGVEGSGHLSYFLPAALALLGFHGIFYFRTPGKKVMAWCLLQASAALFAFFSSNLEGLPHPLLRVLAWEILGVGLAVAIVLFGWSRLSAPEIPKRKGS